jgi:hydrogenase expression/formation protein HypD
MSMDLSAYRDPELVDKLRRVIMRDASSRSIRIMHVCGTHEHAICQYGLRKLLPKNLEVISGPGCPVCVCPPEDIEQALVLAANGIIITTFGDMMRVPSTRGKSLSSARRYGSDVRMVGGINEAIKIAHSEPNREVAFFAVGFETTASTFAAALSSPLPDNFSVLSSIRVIPPALEFILERAKGNIDGYLLPGHVCAIIGLEPFIPLAESAGVPMAIAGFQPVDILQGLSAIVEDLAHNKHGSHNMYDRLVKRTGNSRAIKLLAEVFEPVDAFWRGIGNISGSGLVLQDKLAQFDARRKFGLNTNIEDGNSMPSGCRCGEVLLGEIKPAQCGLFGNDCLPSDPRGPCMVSSEGACHAALIYPEDKEL